MGAWGYGLLENDTALDGLGEVTDLIETAALEWTTGSEENAARLGAAVGLMLSTFAYGLNPETEFYPRLIRALEENRPYFHCLPGASAAILQTVMDDGEGKFGERKDFLPPRLRPILFGEGADTAAPEYPLTDLFRHPSAITWLHNLASELTALVDEGFSDEEIVNDLSREAECMGAFAVLVMLGPPFADRAAFRRWREQVQQAIDSYEPTGDEREDTFEQTYNRHLEQAFALILS